MDFLLYHFLKHYFTNSNLYILTNTFITPICLVSNLIFCCSMIESQKQPLAKNFNKNNNINNAKGDLDAHLQTSHSFLFSSMRNAAYHHLSVPENSKD